MKMVLEAKDKNSLFNKILLVGIVSLISGFIVAFWVSGSSTVIINLFVLMLLWIMTTLLIILVALVEDLNEELKFIMKELVIETKMLRDEFSLLKEVLKKKGKK